MPWSLSPEDKRVLNAVAGGSQAALVRRAQIVLGWGEGLEPEQIAEQVGLTTRTVRRWLKAFEEEGLDIFPPEALPDSQPIQPVEHEENLAETPYPHRLTVADLCHRFQVDMAHGGHVGRLATELFNLARPIHQLDSRYADLIYNAGLLHNVGLSGGAARHHKRGRDILLDHPLSDLSDDDRALIAVTTAFHRKRWKDSRLETEDSYTSLPKEAQPIALILAALVRMADGLDYSQSQSTHLGAASVGKEGIRVSLMGPYIKVDGARADRKADLWRAIFETPISFLFAGEALSEEESLLPGGPGLLPDDLMNEAGRKILKFHFERMLFNEAGTRDGRDIEALHDMRVATRRMRTALRLFGQYYTGKTRRQIGQGLRQTGRALGSVRDLDVFMENMQQYLAELPADRQPDLAVINDQWGRQYERARQKMLAYLDSDVYQEFVAFMSEFVNTAHMGNINSEEEGPRPACIKYIAPRLIYTHYETVRAYEAVLDKPSLEILHRLRIDGKQLRYTLEFFREVLGEEAGDVIQAMVALQDHLGALNDAEVAQELLRRYMKRIVKRARKKQKRAKSDSVDLPDLSGAIAYLDSCEHAIEHLVETFPPIWDAVITPETRRKLALAVGVL
jgi:CHAD domain-containing protein